MIAPVSSLCKGNCLRVEASLPASRLEAHPCLTAHTCGCSEFVGKKGNIYCVLHDFITEHNKFYNVNSGRLGPSYTMKQINKNTVFFIELKFTS